MRIRDTATGRMVELGAAGEEVRIYCCGITPYGATHLGHAVTFLAVDVLQRHLRDQGHPTRCVRNVTDVDEPLLDRARELGVHHLDLAAGELARFDADLDALGLLPAWSEPRTSGAIADIRLLVGELLGAGLAYESDGAVYLDSRRCSRLGDLSGLDPGAMLERGRTAGEDPDDPRKRHPLDTPLWLPSSPGDPEWDTRWGPGRPGWHVQCAAMARRELGEDIDVHVGGADLIHPHHEFERAIGESAGQDGFVRCWWHVGLVHHQGTKMSKSAGNLVLVSELLESWRPSEVRLAVLDHDLAQPWEWDEQLLGEARRRLDHWWSGRGGPSAGEAEVRRCLDEGLDTAGALAVIDALADQGADVTAAASLLGIDLLSD